MTQDTNQERYEKYKAQNESAYWLLSALARFGVARFVIGREFAGYGFPSAVAAELTAPKSNNQAVDTWDAEVVIEAAQTGEPLAQK